MTPSASQPDNRLLRPDKQGVQTAAQALKGGKLVAFPSETVYGLGADATNDNAVAAIYAAKGRPTFNPLIVHVPSVEAARQYVLFDKRAERLCDAFCPGALSLVLPRREDSPLSLLVSAGLDSVAMRIPSHPIAQQLLSACGRPVAAPSANPSGAVSPTAPLHVLNGWPDPEQEGPLYIIDGGACAIGLESTVLDLTTPTATLLRPGGVSLEEIEPIIGPVAIAMNDDTAPKSPGMLSRHYAPKTPVRLNAKSAVPGELFLGFGPDDLNTAYNLSPKGNLNEAAANLFSFLRRLDDLAATSIAIAPIPNTGLGLAINDRLKRAATYP